MRGFEDLHPLTARVDIYVPATDGVNTAADTAAHVDGVAATLSAWFGGATIAPGAGCWVSDAVGLVKEATTVVYAYCTPEQLEARAADLRQMCADLAADLHQECIGVSLCGKMYFVPPVAA